MEPQHTITRTRTIKPSIRLRQSPDLSKTRPTTTEYPVFPLPHVALHPDDSASKVLLAIGRSFMSVDNKAMTIKDLSEIAMNMGYNCQNVSAASQAITTYIRAHLQRCETQQDQPLLLRHVLSGTPADDNLLPALHSTCGGASTSAESRATNFRRGTVVWYLSRSTGAPCPFARAGIRLCDYVDQNASQSTSKKRIDSQQCGQKRKRRSTRECVLKNSAPLEPSRESTRSLSPLSSLLDSDDESDSFSDNEEPPAIKLKLTLRLPPLTRVRQEAAVAQFSPDIPVPYRRSPSVPYSVASIASPPPESENEEEDTSDDDDEWPSTGKEIDIPMDDDAPAEEEVLLEDPDEDEARFSDEWDDDNDDDLSTTWESPGPRSPSAQPPAFRVKEEPRDVQGLLDQWEYDLDVKDPLLKAEESSHHTWDWDQESAYHVYNYPSSSPSNNSSASMSSPIESRIKQEDDYDLPLSFSGPAFTAWRQSGTLSPTTPFGFAFSEETDMFPMSPSDFPVSPVSPTSEYTTLRPRAGTLPSLSLGGYLPGRNLETSSRPSDSHSLASLVHSLSMNSPTVTRPPNAFSAANIHNRLPSVFSENEENETTSESYASREEPPSCVSPGDIRIGSNGVESLIVNTCEPCLPQIIATHIEGIAVYQSSLGPHTLLRRIDTDFVNLTPIIKYAQTPQPMTVIPGATSVTKGRQEVQGFWVPLDAMRLYVQDCILTRPSTSSSDPLAILDIFLSDTLAERFPAALREFVRTTRANSINGLSGKHFGKSFGGDDTSSSSLSAGTPNPTAMAAAAAKDRVPVHEEVFPPHSSFGVSMSITPSVDVPLSDTEEKIFDEFCVNLEWDNEENGDGNVMDIEDALRTALPLMRTPERSTRARSRARRVSISPPSSPLSSCPPSPVLDKAQLCTSISSKSAPVIVPQADTALPSPSPGSLRRSKRVADALAAKSNVRTRASSRKSRNLS
ncbi:hypothetical protein DFJ43DRAFT_789270 [Lentinula guzmanii]|uniref:GDS1 winged helix domain-containing protein n=1 Tax=Lentinula guzmanii TaxID=2804957 RepID=A0AA38JBF7_9AGAR|nr:hypothetical protein DFJ43DRAFT_789270 [Lentinula guzmanii]